MKYARTCSVTGKGMNEGWVWFGGEFYTSTQEITIAELRKSYSESDGDFWGATPSELSAMTDDELLQWGFDKGMFFWTEWED